MLRHGGSRWSSKSRLTRGADVFAPPLAVRSPVRLFETETGNTTLVSPRISSVRWSPFPFVPVFAKTTDRHVDHVVHFTPILRQPCQEMHFR